MEGPVYPAKGAHAGDMGGCPHASCPSVPMPDVIAAQVNNDRQQQEQLQETNEASTSQMEQQMRQSPGSVTQQQINNKARFQLPTSTLQRC